MKINFLMVAILLGVAGLARADGPDGTSQNGRTTTDVAGNNQDKSNDGRNAGTPTAIDPPPLFPGLTQEQSDRLSKQVPTWGTAMVATPERPNPFVAIHRLQKFIKDGASDPSKCTPAAYTEFAKSQGLDPKKDPIAKIAAQVAWVLEGHDVSELTGPPAKPTTPERSPDNPNPGPSLSIPTNPTVPNDDGGFPGGPGGGGTKTPPADETQQFFWRYGGGVINDNLKRHPDDPGALGLKGLRSCQDADYGACNSYTRRAIENGSKNPSVFVAYGASAYQLGDHATANEAGAKALELDPDNAAADRLYKLSMDKTTTVKLPPIGSALSALNAQSYDAAMAQANKGAKSTSFFGTGGANPASGGVSAGMGSSGMTAAEIAAAAARQSEAPRSNIEQSSALTKEAASDLGLHDYQTAYNIATKAIDLNPRNAQAWNYRAIADNKLEKFSDAVYDASFSLGLAPGNAPALQTRSWAFSKQGKYKEALADANFTLEKEPQNGFAYQNRAYALAGMGDKSGALEALRRSAELDPRFKEKFDKAMQAPQESDLLFLFDDDPAAKIAAAAAAAGQQAPRKGRFMRLAVLSMAGGLLVAIGLLHIVSASWRERVNTTIRRVLGGSAPAAQAAADTEGGAVSGFWSQYRVLKQIGTGGMGLVYQAKDVSLDRSVAIKKMRDEIRSEPSERQRFITEARTVAALHHPNIVDIYSIAEDESDVYLVFEYVDGQTLSDALRDKGTFDLDGALKVMRGVCDAVDYAHRQKVIHRDIKPSNIMISAEGRVKVMDFGVARQAKDAMTKMSLTNTVVGTPPYMAPEQEQGTVRKESDVFALGVVLYELVTGKLPFQGQGAGMLLNKINGRHIPVSQAMDHALPAALDEVLNRALAPDPEKRYRTPAEFLAALEAVAAPKAG